MLLRKNSNVRKYVLVYLLYENMVVNVVSFPSKSRAQNKSDSLLDHPYFPLTNLAVCSVIHMFFSSHFLSGNKNLNVYTSLIHHSYILKTESITRNNGQMTQNCSKTICLAKSFMDLAEGRASLAPLLLVHIFIFMQFLTKMMPNNRLAPSQGLAPPLGNPRSATENISQMN